MKTKNEIRSIVTSGILLGLVAVGLVYFGNPANMGFCIACFLRDTAGALKLHSAAVVQYIRPEIMGLVLGSFLMALRKGEFHPRGGSAPLTRFLLGFCVMVGCLCFLGCPFRMMLRLAGGDLNALTGLVGFVAGIGTGVFFLRRGYSLKRTYAQPKAEGLAFPIVQILLLALLVFFPTLLVFSEKGPGSAHAPLLISLTAGLLVGALAQRTRLCMAGGIRDMMLFREKKLLMGFIALFVAALCGNLLLQLTHSPTFFKLSFRSQPVSHSAHLWNFLGMALVGFGSTLLGGCPLRQLILSGEGNTDAAITVLGFTVGAAFCHNFSLAGSADAVNDGIYTVGGPGINGKIAVLVCLAAVLVIACFHTFRKSTVSERSHV